MIDPVSAELSMSVDQHGSTPVQLVCEAPNAGALVIEGGLITAFLDFGVSGFPTANYDLATVDEVQLEPGWVELAVRSHRQTPLTVEGHTPCDSPEDCREGQTCDLKIQTCS